LDFDLGALGAGVTTCSFLYAATALLAAASHITSISNRLAADAFSRLDVLAFSRPLARLASCASLTTRFGF